MPAAKTQPDYDPEFNYHMLRIALSLHSRNLSDLDPCQYQQVWHKSIQSYELESLVLASPEAKALMIREDRVEDALQQVATRYADEDEFLADLQANSLDPDCVRRALRRELTFDGAMRRVACRAAKVNDVDMRLFYEMHIERFETPELRAARHILITVNHDYLENTRPAALARIEPLGEKLRGRAGRFQDMARRHSECPTSMDGGNIGEVRRGVLYPELDAVLFGLQEGKVSSIVESEIGFHILLCEKIKLGKRTSFAKAAATIREILEARRQRSCQKAWLAELQQSASGCGVTVEGSQTQGSVRRSSRMR